MGLNRIACFATASLLGWALVFLAGCKGVSTQSELQSRADLKAVRQAYQPGDLMAALPTLDTNATLGVFLTYAMLNQPKVAATYFDWAASVERITTARSFPDPQLTFQMDIQNLVTSIMPGLMGSIPWPSKLRVGADVASRRAGLNISTFNQRFWKAPLP